MRTTLASSQPVQLRLHRERTIKYSILAGIKSKISCLAEG